MRLFLAAIAVTFSTLTTAASLPQPMVYDQRVREVAYNPEDIVTIHAAYGIATHIKFAPDETITHTILGDTVAWETTPVGNNLFIKPVELNADTNLSVVTNKHVYGFDLKAAPKTTDKVFFQVVFIYPDQEMARREAAAQLSEQTTRLNEMRARLERLQAEQVAKLDNAMHDAEIPLRRSINYWVKGSEEAQPDEAYDDGTFTYFRFRGNREFPTVYLRDSKGQDSLVNTTVKGDTILVQRIAKDYVLRKGNDVALVTNPNYDRIGVANETGTITPAVTRTVIGEIDPLPQTLPTRQPAHKVVSLAAPPTRIEPTKTIPSAPPAQQEPTPAPLPPVVEAAPEAPQAAPAPLALAPEPLEPEPVPPAAAAPPIALVTPAEPAPVLTDRTAPLLVTVPPYSPAAVAVEAPAAVAPPAPPVEVVAAPVVVVTETPIAAVTVPAEPDPTAPAAVAAAPVQVALAEPAPEVLYPHVPAVVVIEPEPHRPLVPRSEPELGAVSSDPIPLEIKRKGNLRSAPSTAATLLGGVAVGDALTAVGRDRSAQWLLINRNGQLAWLSASLATVHGRVIGLPIYQADAIVVGYENHAHEVMP